MGLGDLAKEAAIPTELREIINAEKMRDCVLESLKEYIESPPMVRDFKEDLDFQDIHEIISDIIDIHERKPSHKFTINSLKKCKI